MIDLHQGILELFAEAQGMASRDSRVAMEWGTFRIFGHGAGWTGRPRGRNYRFEPVADDRAAEIRTLAAEGLSFREIERRTGVGRNRISRILQTANSL